MSKPRWTLEAGRLVLLDGKRAFNIARCEMRATDPEVPALAPVQVDELARRIVYLLNLPCRYCNGARHLSRTKAVRLKVGNASMACPLCTYCP